MVLVAELDKQPVGYISCHLLDQAKGQIGLCGVSKESQGKGIGLLLVSASLRWFVDHGVQRATVVTQGRNCKAQRLYQRCGFLTQSVQLWFHKWFPLTEAKTSLS
jgi:dTDP-4-amino-4,6-dideoxy-D-galactose acyltransferase